MNEDRKSFASGKWILFALVAMLALYPLSFPPACWIGKVMSHPDPRLEAVESFYAPLNWLVEKSPPARRAMGWYYYLWMDIAAFVQGSDQARAPTDFPELSVARYSP